MPTTNTFPPRLVPPTMLAIALSCGVTAMAQTTAQTNEQTTTQTPAQTPAQTPPAAAPDRVEVTGARFREQAGKSSLSGDELARQPGTGGDPMKAIQSLPGVAAVDDASSEPAVRGARPSDNAYYADFLPVGYLFHTGGFASVFNPSLVQRFSLASAAWSPEYGNVVGAVFDINLRNPRTDRLAGQADFGLLGANVLFEGPLSDTVSFFVAARRSWFDVVAKTAEDKEEGVTFTVPVYTDTQSRLLWSLSDRQRLRLDVSTASDRIAFSVKAGGQAAARDPIIAGNSSQRQSFGSAGVVWEYEPSERVAHRVAAGHMNQDLAFRLGGAGSVVVKLGTTTLRQQLVLTPGADHEITLGSALESRLIDARLDFNFARCTEFDPNCDISTAPRVVSDQRARQNTSAVHASDRWQLAPRWTATAGLRISHDAYLQRSAAEPRLALEFSPDKRLTLSAAVGRHSQPPAPEESLAIIGNPRLAPVRSNHAVLGLSQLLPEGWSWRAEVYGKTFDNFAVADPALNFRNGARGTARGLELLVRKDPAGSRLSGFASLSLSRARRAVDATGASFPFDFDQPVIATVVGQWKASDRWSYGAKWSYHTGAPYTPVVGTGVYPDGRVRPVYGAVNSLRVPAYHRLDLRVDVRWSARWSGYFELINAYNRQNVAGYSYSPDYATREEIRQLPLLPSFGVKAAF